MVRYIMKRGKSIGLNHTKKIARSFAAAPAVLLAPTSNLLIAASRPVADGVTPAFVNSVLTN